MATVSSTAQAISTSGSHKCSVITWTPLTSANAVGEAYQEPGYADRSIQVVGTFDSATVVLQGSNDGTNWATLTDGLGNAVSFTATGLKQVYEITRYVRPSTSGGGGSQSVSVYFVSRGE